MTQSAWSDRERRSGKAAASKPENSQVKQHAAANRVIDLNARIYPAHKLAALVDTLGDLGVQATSLLSGSELTERQLRSAAALISYRQMIAVLRNALRLSPDPTFALRAGQRMRVTSFGMYGYAAMSSPSHKAAVEFGVKYHSVMGPFASMSLMLDANDVMFAYDPILSANPRDGLYRSCVEFVFASHLTLNKDLYGPSFRFARVCVEYPAPDYADAYKRVFGCPVEFGHPRNEVSFEEKWLNDPVPFSDPITNAMAQKICDQVFSKADHGNSIASQIHRLLVDRPGWFPRIDKIAAQLSMSPRMLHRRLKAEQTTYRELVNEIRMSVAIEYLRETRMTNEEIAARLGYSDAANFRHAFTRWTGKRPSDYRA